MAVAPLNSCALGDCQMCLQLEPALIMPNIKFAFPQQTFRGPHSEHPCFTVRMTPQVLESKRAWGRREKSLGPGGGRELHGPQHRPPTVN